MCRVGPGGLKSHNAKQPYCLAFPLLHQEARVDREAAAVTLRQVLGEQAATSRAENQVKISGIRAESEELLARLGLRKAAAAAAGR